MIEAKRNLQLCNQSLYESKLLFKQNTALTVRWHKALKFQFHQYKIFGRDLRVIAQIVARKRNQ